jgi:transcriptional regulator with XRE-family HTH domain
MQRINRPHALGDSSTELVLRRHIHNLSQIQVSKLLGCSNVSLSQYERGCVTPPARVMEAARRALPI